MTDFGQLIPLLVKGGARFILVVGRQPQLTDLPG